MTSTVFRKRALPCSVFFLSSFLLHLAWENTQAPLFVGYESFAQHFPICFRAAITGDMIFMLTIYLLLALVHRNVWWLSDPKSFHLPATWILPIVIGLLLAGSFELWAIHVAHRWLYAPTMPIIPFLQIGLTPILQMIVVPISVLLLTSHSTANKHT